MDYKEIINKVQKYHYYITSTNKTIFLSSSNNKLEAKQSALEKLKPNIDNLIGKKLILVKIKNVANEFEKQKTSEELKLIGGPILFKFDRGLIESKNTIKTVKEGGNNEIYLSKKYIKKNKENIVFELKKLVSDVVSEKINQGLFAMTII